IYRALSNGIKASGMPAYEKRITDLERWQITLYVRQLQSNRSQKAETDIASNPKPPHPAAASGPVAPIPEQRYQFRGRVVSVDRQLKQVTVAHEAVEGYMGAMTMPFPLKDERLYGVLKAGDLIKATLVIDAAGWRLDGV